MAGPSQSLRSCTFQSFRTPSNIFGLSRTYYSTELPSHDPESVVAMQDMLDSPNLSPTPHVASGSFHPYPNQSSFRLGDWYWNHGIQKSQQSFKELLSIIGDPKFFPDDVRKTKWTSINRKLAANDFDEDADEWLDEDAGWKQTPISITVPFHHRMKDPGPQNELVFTLYHRSIVSVIKEKLANPSDDCKFHYEPYDLFWKPNAESFDVRVHGELYTSAAFREAHRDIQDSPGEPGCDLPRVVVSLMLWSDATHLTSFGHAKLWPCYLYFRNESKYRRCKPSCHLCNHIAYFQTVCVRSPSLQVYYILRIAQLPHSFKDFAAKHTGGRGPNQVLLAHCHREAFHAQWKVILDDEFIGAYKHGIVIVCCDGITRRFYPRLFTYSADYPEK